MIRVLVELWPGGSAARAEAIGQVFIANQTPARDPADYVAVVLDAQWRTVAVQAVRHERAQGWPQLLRDALAPAGHPPEGDLAAVAERIVGHVLDAVEAEAAARHPEEDGPGS